MKILKTIITLVLVVTISTVAVWGVNSITEPIITERAAKEAAKAYAVLVNDDNVAGKDVTADYKNLDSAGIISVMELTLSDGTVAYGMQASATGYHDGILYAIAVNMETKTIYGIKVISHGETNGKGSLVLASEKYLNYFKGLSLEATLNSTAADTDVTTGSSVTSRGMDTSVGNVAKYALNNFTGGEA